MENLPQNQEQENLLIKAISKAFPEEEIKIVNEILQISRKEISSVDFDNIVIISKIYGMDVEVARCGYRMAIRLTPKKESEVESE